MEQVFTFGKEEIALRLQLPMERIEILVDECGMPVTDENKFVEWGVQNFARLWEEMKEYGPIAQMAASAPVSVAQTSDGNSHK